MTHPTREEAARSHAESEGNNGNAEISFLAGAEWERKRIMKLIQDECDAVGIPSDRVKMQASWIIRRICG